MTIKIEWIQLLFFTFSFATFFSHGVTNNVFVWKVQNSNWILLLLLINMLFFITGKIYGNLLNRIPLRLISYIFFVQSALSIFLIPKSLVLNCLAAFIKSFLSGIAYSTIFSLMSHKTEKWRLKRYPLEITAFILTILTSNVLIYMLTRLKAYITIISDAAIGYMLYKISSDDVKMDQIVEDKDKLTDAKFIFNAFFNSLNSIIIFIVQKERAFIIAQILLIIRIIALISFFCILGKDVLFVNKNTYYYIAIESLKKINSYITNDTIHHHIEHISQRLETKMIDSLLVNMNIKKKSLETNAKQ